MTSYSIGRMRVLGNEKSLIRSIVEGNAKLREGGGLLTTQDMIDKKRIEERQKLRNINSLRGRNPKFLCPKCMEPVRCVYVRNAEGHFACLPTPIFYCPNCDSLIRYKPEMIRV